MRGVLGVRISRGSGSHSHAVFLRVLGKETYYAEVSYDDPLSPSYRSGPDSFLCLPSLLTYQHALRGIPGVVIRPPRSAGVLGELHWVILRGVHTCGLG